MLDVLKALFVVLVAWLFRFLGVTEKRKEPLRYVRTNPNGPQEKLPAWKEQAIRQVNQAVIQILNTGNFNKEESELIFMVTHIMSGLVDKPGIVMRCDFQFLEDEQVRIEFGATDNQGRMVQTQALGLKNPVISLKDREFLSTYFKSLVDFQTQKDAVRASVFSAAAEGADSDKES